MTAFSTVKIRTAAVVICDHQVALIHRRKDGTDQYTLPGGNVEPGEPLSEALRRELAEELGLRLDPGVEMELLAVQDQMVSRPGNTPPPRKLHLVFRIVVTPGERDDLATVEHDDLGQGRIVWMPLQDLSKLHLFPAVGEALAKHEPRHPAAAVLLPPLTDETFQWI